MDSKTLSNLLGRSTELFESDFSNIRHFVADKINKSSFLVIGGSGTIGSEVVKLIFENNPKKLHVVSLDENGTVELVRDIRSSLGYINGDFRTFVFDASSDIFEFFLRSEGPYDYLLNFSALKHVRTEKDPYSLMSMIHTNVFLNVRMLKLCQTYGIQNYFAISSTKAVSLSSLMGATKRLMEYFMLDQSRNLRVVSTRLPNVAFSTGSLLGSYTKRLEEYLPIVAPIDKRYFITVSEAAKICLIALFTASSGEIYFPKFKSNDLTSFSQIAEKFLEYHGYKPYVCETEEQARQLATLLPKEGRWACYFFKSDTTGEEDEELFYDEDEELILDRFENVGVVKPSKLTKEIEEKLSNFILEIEEIKKRKWTKKEILFLFEQVLTKMKHNETWKYLDQRM